MAVLRKDLTLLNVFCIASGAMISSGLFILPGIAHAQAGPAVTVSYLLAGLLAMTGMLSQAELVSAMPKAGGTYFYVTRSMGPAIGTVDGLVTWFSLCLKSAFALVGMAAFTAMLTSIDIRVIAAALCIVFTGINLSGVKEAGRVQVVLVFGLIAILLFYIARGIPAVRVQSFDPFAPHGAGAILATAGFVFVSFGGLLKVASIAEEVKSPGRVIPLGMILSLLVVTILYLLTVFVTSGVLGAGELDNSLTPISDGARAFMGRPGMIALGVAAILAFISTANAGIMAASRYLLALSRDDLIPARLGRVDPKRDIPYIAVLITGAFMIGTIFLDLRTLVKAASSVLILTYTFSCLSVIILRESRIQNYQPKFRAPLYPWVQIAGLVGFGLLLVKMGGEALIASSIFIIAGLCIFWIYGRIRANREYALLHLVERITAKELTSGMLESELREIIRERDEIITDRFDRIIEKALVLDIEESVSAAKLFEMVAARLAPRIDTPAQTLVRLMHEREKESSTVITPTLAIPHIIIDGEKRFCVMLVRCRGGVVFSGLSSRVQAVFVLAGTRDERNFHLRVLSSIAQIVSEPEFEKRWLAAKDENALRDVILLGERRRY